MNDHLRQVAVDAAVDALLHQQWTDQPSTAHRHHTFSADCALCRCRLDEVVPVALDAADQAVRALAGRQLLAGHVQDAGGGTVTVLVDRGTRDYPASGERVLLYARTPEEDQ